MPTIDASNLIKQLSLVSIAVIACCYPLINHFQSLVVAKAFCAAYLVVAANLILLTYLINLIINASVNPKSNTRWLKQLLVGLGLFKLVFFIAAFFLLISVLKLPPIAICLGAFLSIIVNVSHLSLNFVRKLSSEKKALTIQVQPSLSKLDPVEL